MEAQIPSLDALSEAEPSNLHSSHLGPDGVNGWAKMQYDPDRLKWVHFGTQGDHPKSWGLMGGGVGPGLRAAVLFTVTVDDVDYALDEKAPDRKSKIGWYLNDGYMPSPVSEWDAGPIHVRIQHFGVRTPDERATTAYSRVQLTNRASESHDYDLYVNASPELEVPISVLPSGNDNLSMNFAGRLDPGRTQTVDFAANAAGEWLSSEELRDLEGFDSAYRRMVEGYEARVKGLAHPVRLPNPGVANMYRAIQIMLWGMMVDVPNGDAEIRAGVMNPGRLESYDRTFPHDVPNYVDQFMREGDYDLAKSIIDSHYYQILNSSNIEDWDGLNYMDTIGKWMLPYAQYLQNTGDEAYFDEEVMSTLKRASRNIHDCRVTEEQDPEHAGLMRKGEDFENWSDDGDYLLCDNWAAMHGLQAYKYICDRMGNQAEADWAQEEIDSLNEAVNRNLDRMMERRGTDYYWGAFDDVAFKRYTRGSFYSWVPYAGALSTFPWGATLKGCTVGGTWRDYYDASIDWALHERDRRVIPEGSWGAWWSHVTYGTTYNASAGLQCLISDKHRTQALANVEFLYANQCAPFQWSEAFESKGRDQWVGMYLPQESYGNYESWGTSFTKQSTLQACISVATDGTVIIGRGIPNHWLKPGDITEWADVNVNDGRLLGYTLESTGDTLKLTLSGDEPLGPVVLGLPAMVENIQSATAGEIDPARGTVTLEPGVHEVEVSLAKPIQV